MSWFTSHRLLTASGTFSGQVRALHEAFQMRSEGIGPGYSGGPLWDERRRLVVGLVRSGVSPHQPKAVFCTSSRALATFGEIELSVDLDMQQATAAAASLVRHFTSVRHPEVANLGDVFVEPMIRAMPMNIDNGLSADVDAGLPAMGLLTQAFKTSPMVCLSGAPGSGKSMLARHFARHCLDSGVRLGARPVLPLLCDAIELRDQFSLADLFELAKKRDDSLPQNGALAEALRLNEIDALLIIDGLDEIPERHRVARLIAHCHGLLAGNDGIAYVLLTSRPDEQILAVRNRPKNPVELLEVLPFDEDLIERFAMQRIGEEDRRNRFLTRLQRAEWHRDAAPMQLEMAAMLFNLSGDLPLRESDLAFEYVQMRVRHARRTSMAPENDGRVSESWVMYRKKIDAVIQGLALVSLKSGPCLLEDLPNRLHVLNGHAYFSGLFDRPKECKEFVERDLVVNLGLVAMEMRSEGQCLVWEHQTLLDATAAGAQIAVANGDPEAIGALVAREARESAKRFTLIQLAALDRSGWKDQVAFCVKEAMAAPFSNRDESLFALRALAIGVELPIPLRRKLVALLVRVALAPNADATYCAEFFSTSAGLPKSRQILQREELRQDVVEAMWHRFRLRDPRRHGQRRPLVVTRAEATLLDLLNLWNEWTADGLELAPPNNQTGSYRRSNSSRNVWPAPSDAPSTEVYDRGGFEVMHRDGTVTQMEIPARSFLEGVATMAQAMPFPVPPSHIVSLYLRGLAANFDPPSRLDDAG